MLKSLIATLTALHVLAHGVFGCCDHVVASAASHPCACSHSDHDHLHAASGACELVDDESPTHLPHDCVHDTCHWVVGDVVLNLNLLDVSLPVVYAVVVSHAADTLHSDRLWPDVEAGSLSAPPLRSHLALSVILV